PQIDVIEEARHSWKQRRVDSARISVSRTLVEGVPQVQLLRVAVDQRRVAKVGVADAKEPDDRYHDAEGYRNSEQQRCDPQQRTGDVAPSRAHADEPITLACRSPSESRECRT